METCDRLLPLSLRVGEALSSVDNPSFEALLEARLASIENLIADELEFLFALATRRLTHSSATAPCSRNESAAIGSSLTGAVFRA